MTQYTYKNANMRVYIHTHNIIYTYIVGTSDRGQDRNNSKRTRPVYKHMIYIYTGLVLYIHMT